MVVASSGWIQNASDSNQEKMSATGILICHDNSYPFHERTLSLEQPIKIGRSVARARAATDNAIFDCKVLSRNHALLWYDSGKFYLKDTKSSNGTFVNSKRLSPSGEESTACEVCSGDVVQFGVDVVESTKKVTHGCIIATLKLYLPDGKEAKASLTNNVAYVNVTLEDLYKLNQLIQEAGRRENALRSKLEYMQQLLEHTRDAANQSWKALVLEDCLLSRLEMLESQVLAYSKNFGEDKLRIAFIDLMIDRAQYQTAAKELLQKKVQEKREIIGKVQILNCRLNETDEETRTLRNIIKDNQNELQELAIKHIKLQQILQDTTDKLNKTKLKLKEVMQQSEKEKQEFIQKLEEQKSIEKNLQISLRDSKLDTVHFHKQISALRNYMQTLQDIQCVTSTSSNSKDYTNPIDVINIILSKWNSMYIESLDNVVQTEDQSHNEINCINDLKFYKSFNMNDYSPKNNFSMTSSILRNNYYKYILPPVPSKNLLATNNILDSKHLHDRFINEFLSLVIDNSLNFITTSDLNIPKINENILVSEIEDNNSDNEKENIASIKLIMRFYNNKNDKNFAQKSLQTDNFKMETDHLDLENLNNTLSSQLVNIVQQIDTVTDLNKNLSLEKCKSNIEQIFLQNNYVVNTSNLLVKNNFTLTKCIQQFVLKDILSSSNFLKENSGNEKYNIIAQELQDLKNWLLCESNEVIIDKIKKYYYQVENEARRVQELSEQLVILKEQYNMTVEEKSNITKKYMNLEAECKNFINTTYTVPIYYVAPFMFALLWILLEKILY